MPQQNLAIPNANSTALTANTAGNGRIVLPTAQGGARGPLLIYNPTVTLARVRVGNSAVVAASTSFPVLPGTVRAINPGDTATHITAWCASSTVGLEVFALGGE